MKGKLSLKISLRFAAAALVATVVAAGPLFAQSAEKKFQAFWTQFQGAVAKDDAAAVADLTKLPFMVSNESLDRAAYIKQYKKLFGGLKRCIAKGKPIKDENSYAVFCGEQGMMFAEIDGEYKFTEFFAND